MKKIKIRGGKKLFGDVTISGGKNAALPIVAAAMLCDESITLLNVPNITDIQNSCDIIRYFGGEAYMDGNILHIDAKNASGTEIPEEEALKMRSSVLFAGALLGRNGKAFLPKTGGCRLGKRPIDMHIEAFRKMGVKIKRGKNGNWLEADKLKGSEIDFSKKSVGATENVMIAATMAEGRTVIKNAAAEPEIIDLQNFLNSMGANIRGAGSDVIVVDGVSRLYGSEYEIMPDRIEAGTFLCAAAASGGEILLKNVQPEMLKYLIDVLVCCGCIISYDGDTVSLYSSGELNGGMHIKTMPFPGFPTDMQAQISAVLAKAEGESRVEESIFSSRRGHIEELNKMGADIKIMTERKFFVQGGCKYKGANVKASDLRAGAALIIAALCAEGESIIDGAEYIFRGYENIAEKLKGLGADIEYIEDASKNPQNFLDANF